MIKTLFAVELYYSGSGSQMFYKTLEIPYALRVGDNVHIALGDDGEYNLTVSETSFGITDSTLYVGLGDIEESQPEHYEDALASLLKAGWSKQL